MLYCNAGWPFRVGYAFGIVLTAGREPSHFSGLFQEHDGTTFRFAQNQSLFLKEPSRSPSTPAHYQTYEVWHCRLQPSAHFEFLKICYFIKKIHRKQCRFIKTKKYSPCSLKNTIKLIWARWDRGSISIPFLYIFSAIDRFPIRKYCKLPIKTRKIAANS